MSKKQTSKKELIIIKSVDDGSWGVIGQCIGGGIPPLGTENASLEITSEQIAGALATPIRGAFEILLGKTTVSFKTEPDRIDSQDINYPTDFVRGWDKYPGNMEFEQLKNNDRLQGAVDGFWDPDKLEYGPYEDFRQFEIWTIVEPQDADGNCVMSLDAIRCKTLVKHYFVTLDSVDESREVPNKLSIPISRRFYNRYKNFTFPTIPQEIYAGVGIGPGSITAGITQIREHSRVWYKVENVTGGPGTITIYGTNVVDEPVAETITTDDVDVDDLFVGDTYFKTITSILVEGVTTLDLTIQDYDFGLKNPRVY